MNFDTLDKQMRVYEKSLDQIILPETYMVARLDGRNFTRLTKETCQFEAPFDMRFRDLMITTTKSLMDCGFRILTESDEISLLFSPEDNTFGRKVRKYNSTLAGEASAAFSLALGLKASFDCRIVPLPNLKRLQDYFVWRQEDAYRNSLNAYCYWTLRKEGMTARAATALLEGKSVAYKNELLFSKGINFNDIPAWQKRGIGIIKESYEKEGLNPISGKSETVSRNRLTAIYDLPMGKGYADLIASLLME